MFRAKTVFVLGAGASFEVGLPLGDKLLNDITGLIDFRFEIGRLIRGSSEALQALNMLVGERIDKELHREVLNQHLRSGQQLCHSAALGLSIDNVIEALEDEKAELVGKVGIATSILGSEHTSRHFQPSQRGAADLIHSKFVRSWYPSLVKILAENIKRSEVDSVFDNIEIVNFNYDRCLEHYLSFALSDYYGLSREKGQSLVSGLTVHRPYGMCGKLPWMTGDMPSVPFGACEPGNIASVAGEIRTFTEQVEEGDELKAIRGAIGMADRIIFLGFAFHRQNVKLIASAVQPHTEILGTACGVSESDQSVIADELAKQLEFDDVLNPSQRITLADCTCEEFFKRYWRTITAEASEYVSPNIHEMFARHRPYPNPFA